VKHASIIVLCAVVPLAAGPQSPVPPAPVRVALPSSAGAAPMKAPVAAPRDSMTAPLSVVALSSHAGEPASAHGGSAEQTGSLLAVADPLPRSFKLHDLVTIQVTESSRSKTSGKAKTDKKYDLAAEVSEFWNFDFSALGEKARLSGNQLPGVALNGQKKFDTKGDVDRKDDFTARVTAEVIEVRPNGTLVLEAYKHIKTDDEEQTIRLSGECRAEDVDVTNTVPSQRLANASVEKMTKGQVRDATEKGFLAQVLDTIFAF